jgi:hypothetical protein
VAITGSWILSYWADEDATIPVCQQAYEFVASADIGDNAAGGVCTLCTAQLQILNVTDVTGISTDLDTPCDPVVHLADQDNVGEMLTNPGVMGDILEPQFLVEMGVAIDSGVTISKTTSAASLEKSIQGAGLQGLYIGWTTQIPGGYWEGLNLASSAPPPPGSTDLIPLWTYYGPQGTPAGLLDGQIGILMLWRITYGDEAPSYVAWSLAGVMTATFTSD